MFPVVVVNDRSANLNGIRYYSYKAPLPILYSVHGCHDEPDNSTIRCSPDQTITLRGDYFTNNYPWSPGHRGFEVRIAFTRYARDCTINSQWMAQCVLPTPQTSQFGG